MNDSASDSSTKPPHQAIRRAGNTLVVATLVALWMTSLAGCTSVRSWKENGFKVGPEYQLPAAPVEVEWIDLQSDPRISADQPDLAAWWQHLNDPVLNELIYEAYDQNLTLRQAGTAIMRARAERGIAAGNLFPQLQEATGSYSRTQASLNTAIPSPVRTFDNWATGVNAGWELDFWGRFRRSLTAADAQLDASVEDYDEVLVILIADVATTYVQIRALQERLEITRANLESQRSSLKIAEAQFFGEATNKLAVNQSRNNIAVTESTIPVLENGLRVANNRLCILLGIPPRDLVSELPRMPIPIVSPELKVGIPADLLRRRPDVRAAERIMAAQSERIGIAEADLYPRITLLGALEWQADSVTRLFEPESVFALVSPGFSWKILNYGRIRNSVRAQQALFETRVYQYQQRVLVAQQEVENAMNGFLNSQDQRLKLEAAVKEIDEAQDIAVTLFDTGATNFNTVYLIEAFRLAQQDQLVVSKENVVLNLINTYRSMGGGWQIRCTPRTPVEVDVLDEPLPEPQPVAPMAPNADDARLHRQLETIVQRLESIENELMSQDSKSNDQRIALKPPAVDRSKASRPVRAR